MPKPKTFKVAKCDLKRTKSIQRWILVVRRQRVLMDADLAALYGVTTKRLNEQFRRNRNRFPEDFAFQLTLTEAKEALRLQNATLKRGQHIKHAPHVFTEHGVIMLASVLNSPAAIQASIYVVRAFVQMRAAASNMPNCHEELTNSQQTATASFRRSSMQSDSSWPCPPCRLDLSGLSPPAASARRRRNETS